jgi:hypothetical protein
MTSQEADGAANVTVGVTAIAASAVILEYDGIKCLERHRAKMP